VTTSNATVRVFVNANGLDVPAGVPALEAVRAWRAEQGADVAAGTRLVTDSRGIAIDPASPVYAGAIYRVVSNRGAARPLEDES